MSRLSRWCTRCSYPPMNLFEMCPSADMNPWPENRQLLWCANEVSQIHSNSWFPVGDSNLISGSKWIKVTWLYLSGSGVLGSVHWRIYLFHDSRLIKFSSSEICGSELLQMNLRIFQKHYYRLCRLKITFAFDFSLIRLKSALILLSA